MKIYLTKLVFRKMQMKTTIKCHSTPTKLRKRWKVPSVGKDKLVHCWREQTGATTLEVFGDIYQN